VNQMIKQLLLKVLSIPAILEEHIRNIFDKNNH
jgi:hypothetical protein